MKAIINVMFAVIVIGAIAVGGMFYGWANSYEKNHNLLDAANMYYHVELRGEDETMYLVKQFANETFGIDW